MKRSYIFTNKRHSYRAIMSTILGIISLISLVIVIYLTYIQGGEAPVSYGVTGLLIAVFSIIGMVLGFITISQKERYRIFPCLGLIFNSISLLGIGFIVYWGTYIS